MRSLTERQAAPWLWRHSVKFRTFAPAYHPKSLVVYLPGPFQRAVVVCLVESLTPAMPPTEDSDVALSEANDRVA